MSATQKRRTAKHTRTKSEAIVVAGAVLEQIERDIAEPLTSDRRKRLLALLREHFLDGAVDDEEV